MTRTSPLLEVEDLRVDFVTDHGVVRAVQGVSFAVDAGETVAVLGESGSGKSVTARTVMGLPRPAGCRISDGSVRFEGTELLTMTDKQLRRLRGSAISMVFQDALSALNPVLPVGYQIVEACRARGRLSRAAARRRSVELLDMVKIPAAARRVDDYPHQFSGGMRQRVMIAMALAGDPKLIIADEPTTALDVTVQAQVLELLAEIQRARNAAVMLITHDIGVVAEVADRVVVMYAGRVVEQGTAVQICTAPSHPYTQALLSSMPTPEVRGRPLPIIEGAPADPTELLAGCAFAPRCPHAGTRCREELPLAHQVSPLHSSACHRSEVLPAHE